MRISLDTEYRVLCPGRDNRFRYFQKNIENPVILFSERQEPAALFFSIIFAQFQKRASQRAAQLQETKELEGTGREGRQGERHVVHVDREQAR